MWCPKAVVTDLDDTLWAPGAGVPQANMAMLAKLKAKHLPVVFCTGRSFGAAQRGRARYGLSELCSLYPGIYCDGAVVYGPGRKILRRSTISVNTLKKVIDVCAKLDPDAHLILCYEEGQLLYNVDETEYLKRIGGTLDPWDEVILNKSAAKTSIGLTFSGEERLLEETTTADEVDFTDTDNLLVQKDRRYFENECLNIIIHSALLCDKIDDLRLTLSDSCAIACFANWSSICLKPLGCDKRKALQLLCTEMGWRAASDIVVLGDGYNDIEMLSCTPFSIAMRDGVLAAREACGYVTQQDAADGGWGRSLEEKLQW